MLLQNISFAAKLCGYIVIVIIIFITTSLLVCCIALYYIVNCVVVVVQFFTYGYQQPGNQIKFIHTRVIKFDL